MTATYRLIPMRFAAQKWADVLRQQDDKTLVVAQTLSGLSASGWWHWLNPKRGKTYEHPGMGNFINVCNLLDLNPADFFELAESEGL